MYELFRFHLLIVARIRQLAVISVDDLFAVILMLIEGILRGRVEFVVKRMLEEGRFVFLYCSLAF